MRRTSALVVAAVCLRTASVSAQRAPSGGRTRPPTPVPSDLVPYLVTASMVFDGLEAESFNADASSKEAFAEVLVKVVESVESMDAVSDIHAVAASPHKSLRRLTAGSSASDVHFALRVQGRPMLHAAQDVLSAFKTDVEAADADGSLHQALRDSTSPALNQAKLDRTATLAKLEAAHVAVETPPPSALPTPVPTTLPVSEAAPTHSPTSSPTSSDNAAPTFASSSSSSSSSSSKKEKNNSETTLILIVVIGIFVFAASFTGFLYYLKMRAVQGRGAKVAQDRPRKMVHVAATSSEVLESGLYREESKECLGGDE